MDENLTEIVAWYVRQYEATGNPIYAADAFVLAVRRGETPPPALLKWIADGLSTWLREKGKADLGKELGLSLGRGREPAFKELRRQQRDAGLFHSMDILTLLGATRTEAAEITLSRFNAVQCDISVETLVSMHARAKEGNEWAGVMVSNPAFVSEFLRKFDSKYLTSNLKSML